ncbi:MAG TPA: hypothetical protein VNG93_02055 [Candidatus Dormibacteraeota bacterium]|nr:hypothetical protein [Candidatus Dormibacteraeota bacterium]
MKKSILALGVSLAALLLSGVSATAATYTSQGYTGQGYDASRYQCSGGKPAPLDSNYISFGIIRVTGGRPFTADSCRQALWNAAENESPPEAEAPSLYLNVAYSGAYGKDVVSGTYCAGVTSASYTGSYLKAYRIGCAEGDYAYNHAPIVESGQTANQMWWLDVETANSWSSSDKVLNQAAIDGAADRLVQIAGLPVGIYSDAYYWNAITTGSGYAPAKASATWVTSPTACGSSFIASLPQLIRQSGLTATGYDADYACP